MTYGSALKKEEKPIEIPKPVTFTERYAMAKYGDAIRSLIDRRTGHADYYSKHTPPGPKEFIDNAKRVAMGEKFRPGPYPTTSEYIEAVNELGKRLAQFGRSESLITKGLERMSALWEKGLPKDLEKRMDASVKLALRPVKVTGGPKPTENYIYHLTMREIKGKTAGEWAVTAVYQITSSKPVNVNDLERSLKKGREAVSQLGVVSIVDMAYTNSRELSKILKSDPYRDFSRLREDFAYQAGYSAYVFKQIYPKQKGS